ncbi:MAG: hypothetical protein ACRDS0_18865 [Pseudonocardiaceae bacterium]
MSRPATSGDDGFEVVVGSDGTLSAPAAELARHGVHPGAHLRLVLHQPQPAKRKSVKGALEGTYSPEAIDAFVDALAEAKAERIAAVERRWE